MEEKGMFAERMSRTRESATIKAMETANRLKAQGIDIVGFNVGEPDFDTPAHIRKAAQKAMDDGWTHYTPSAGIRELREAIADKCSEENRIPCRSKNVQVTTSKFGIFASLVTFVDHGEEVIIPEPSWVSYVDMVHLVGGKEVHVGCSGEDMFRIDPDAVAEAISPKTKMIILNSPCNPTGGIIGPKELKAITDLAEDHDFYILTDEVYEYIIYEGEHISPASIPGIFERTITINGFSKAFSMTGWRMGYVVAPKEFLDGINKIQQQAITCLPGFSQMACITALKSKQSKKAVAKMVKEFKKRREFVVPALNDIPGIECPMSPGTFYAFPNYDRKMYDLTADEMATYLLETGHVSVTSGRAFGPSGENCFRLSYSNNMRNIREGLERIDEALARLRS
jgi:aspartate aminotransferase